MSRSRKLSCRLLVSLLLLSIIVIGAGAMGLAACECKTDSDCGEPGEWIYKNQCIGQVKYFNPAQAEPDSQYPFEKSYFRFFHNNGIITGFNTGKEYTWTQETRHREIPRCIEGKCKIEKEYMKKDCYYGCDIHNTEQCMCYTKDIHNPECRPELGNHIYVLRKQPYRNEEGKCEVIGYDVGFRCPSGWKCGLIEEGGETIPKCLEHYSEPNPTGVGYSNTSRAAARYNTVYSSTGLSKAMFEERYGYDPTARTADNCSGPCVNLEYGIIPTQILSLAAPLVLTAATVQLSQW